MKIFKRIISVILTLFLITSTVALDFSSFAKEEENDIQSFINESRELLSYDVEPVFTTSSVEDNENSEIDFSSCRLILKSTKKPNELNSVGIADGFKDYYIVQFENEIDAKNAYEYYSEIEYISNIAVDEAIGTLTSVTPYEPFIDFKTLEDDENSTTPEAPVYDGVPNRLNSWGAEMTGAYVVKDYLNSNNNIIKNKVTVAVLDSGIEYDHEYFSNKQERLERTYFSITDDSDDEYDNVNGHGTAVTSVIIDSAPDNVVVRNYKIINENDDGNINISSFITTVLQTIIDDVDIINCSFCFRFSEKNAAYEAIEDAYKEVYNNGIITVCSAGNYINESFGGTSYCLPSMLDCVISVTGIQEYGLSPIFSVGSCIDVSGPAEHIPCAYLGGYEYLDGTSFSSPLTAAICAQIITVFPDYAPDIIIDTLKETITPYDEVLNLGNVDLYGVGIVDAVGAIGISRPIVNANLQSGRYEGEINIELSSPTNEDIYYTLDSTYPTPTNGILYTKPIKIYSDQLLVSAVAYDENGIPSKKLSHLYRSTVLADESDFEIDEYGSITKYDGTLKDIIIPETVNGTEVKNIAMPAFENTGITGVSLPNTIKSLGNCTGYGLKEGSFRGNTSLMFIDGENIEEIGSYVFEGCKSLLFIDFPNVTLLKEYAFGQIYSIISQLRLPKLKQISPNSFSGSSFIYLYLPELEVCSAYSFSRTSVYKIYFPKLTICEKNYNFRATFGGMRVGSALDLSNIEGFSRAVFASEDGGRAFCKRLDFAQLTALYDLPAAYSILVLPSKVQVMPENLSDYEDGPYGSIKETYKFYGSAGTYVEEWANEQGFPFIEITQETAVATDLPRYYKPYMGKLEADVIGFNRQYQWYSNDVNSNEGGTPIEGATEKSFDPATCPNAKYYYCEVTSTDGDLDPITIKTSACENRMNVAVEEESKISVVSYEKSRDTHNTFDVTVDGRPAMIQFIEPDGGTRTYDRNHKNVTIKSYDENGNEVNFLDRTLAYEVWTINANLIGPDMRVRAKYLNDAIYSWDKVTYNFVVELLQPDGAVRSVTPAATSGRFGAVETVVVTGPDAEAIRFKMENGTTATYFASRATTLENGDLQFVGKAWANNLGENIITVQVRVKGKWQTAATFTYTADDYPISA